MVSSSLVVLALAVAAQAAPTERATSSFSLPAIHNTAGRRNGTAAMLKAYRKWGLTPTKEFSEHFLKALNLSKKRQDSSAPASPDTNNVEYTVPVTIGGQELQLDFDTGSADLWVFSSLLDSSDLEGHSYFTSDDSTTFEEQEGSTWEISYADGSGASGVVGTDTVQVGETIVEGQVVELADTISSAFAQGANDGLLGLSFSTINTVQPEQATTFFDNAKASLDAPVFAAFLPKATDGSYDFGTLNPDSYTGDIVYTDVDESNGWWEFPSTGYKVGDTEGSLDGQTGIADTGTTLLLTGDGAVDDYYSQVPSAENSQTEGGYVFDCSEELPDFSFQIGDSEYATIPGALVNFAEASASGTCFGGIQSVGGGSQSIYGDVFLNAYYAVFDASVPQFGFATSTGPTS